MADLTSALFRVDPTEGLVEYVQAIKPYHTKVLDVLVEYVYGENVNATVLDRWKFLIGLARTNVDVKYHDPFSIPPYDLLVSDARADVIYACGYGHKWSEAGLVSPEATVSTTIIRADTEPCPDDPTSQDPNNPIMGTVCATNSFLVQGVPSQTFNCVVINTQSNQLMFATPHAITGVNPYTKTWTVLGDLTAGSYPLTVGMHFYVNSNTGPGVNKQYTVAAISPAGSVTNIVVEESISLLATATGTANVPQSFDDIPYWDAGMKVQLASTGTLPDGIINGRDYYFVPTAIPGIFNISFKRYPQEYSEYIDITGLGTGQLTIKRLEPFIPGQTVNVIGSYLNRNDGQYVIGAVIPEGNNYRLVVIETIPATSPVGALTDGLISLNVGGYDEPSYCAVASAPDVHADTFIHEVLKFAFDIDAFDRIDAEVIENATEGWGVMPWGADAMSSPYGTHSETVFPFTAPTPPAMLLLPTGYDVALFDIGGMDETLETSTRNHGRTLYSQ